jgi:hypothetical protein
MLAVKANSMFLWFKLCGWYSSFGGSAYEAKWYVTFHVKDHVSCDIQESSNNSKKSLAPSSTHHRPLPIAEALYLALVLVFKERKQTGVNIYTDSHMMDL